VPAEDSGDELKAEIMERLNRLESARVPQIDGYEMSPNTMRPFKALIYREAMMWRITELGRDAIQAYNARRFASAMLLTRASIETTAAYWYFRETIEGAIEATDLAEAEGRIEQLAFGARNDSEMPAAINVLNFIDKLDKSAKGARANYDILSEYCHPNHAGVMGLFASISPSPSSALVDFGPGARIEHGVVCLNNLSVALMTFEFVNNRFLTAIPAYIARCERAMGDVPA
jgi:hypothetical protein